MFVCDLTDTERARLRRRVHEEIHHELDRVALFDLGPATGRGLLCVEHFGTSRDVADSDPLVW